MKKIVFVSFIIAVFVNAQNLPTIESEYAETPIFLQELQIETEISGNLALTTYIMNFYNPNNRVLEGELNFPLLENQTVVGYGLDINGKLRDGVAVEKNKARKVFEEIERRRIDPGLIEKTEGNNYRTRIYPFNQKEYRTVKVQVQEVLVTLASKNLRFQLPLVYQKTLQKFSLKTTVYTNQKPIQVENPKGSSVKESEWKNAYVYELKKENYQLDGNFVLEIPKPYENRVDYFIENDSVYFLAQIVPNIQEVKHFKKRKSISLYWDCSYSMKDANHQKFYEFLNYFNAENITFNLIEFGWDVSKPKTFTSKDGLVNHLKQIEYDGGSRIGNLKFKNNETIWLVSDGLNNLTEQQINQNKSDLYTFSISNKNNFQYLKQLPARYNVFINLNQITISDAVVYASKHLNYIDKSYVDGNNSTDYYIPNRIVFWKQPFLISGKYKMNKQNNSVLHLDIQNTFRSKSPSNLKVNLLGNPETYTQSELVKRVWASHKIEQLMQNPDANRDKIVSIAKQHTIVTDFTSLLVLEEIEDYVNNQIVPPKELQEEYYALLKEKKEEQQKNEKEFLSSVWDLYEDRIRWWERDFTEELKNYKEDKKTQDDDSSVLYDTVVEAAESPIEEVVVTSEAVERREISSAVQRIEAEELSAAPEPNIESTLQGRAAGVVITDSTSINNNSNENIQTSKDKTAKVELKENELPEYLSYYEKNNSFTVYDSLRTTFNNKPIFFLDVADFHYQKNEKEKAYKALSNLAEIHLEDYILMRILAHQYQQWKQYKTAEVLFTRVLELRDDEPQSYRDLALLYVETERTQEAAELLWHVVKTKWDDRFNGINDLVLFELNNIIHKNEQKIDKSFMNTNFYKPLPVDVRVVLNWSFPDTDLDLWVTNPLEEKTYFQNKLSADGGRISNDFTQGYGPEEYILKKGQRGTYKIDANLYANRLQKLYGSSVLHVEIYTNYGSKNQKKQSITLQLKDEKEVAEIGTFKF